MRREAYKKFADPAVLDQLQALEASEEYQARLAQVKADMTGGMTRVRWLWLGLFLLVMGLSGGEGSWLILFLIPLGIALYRKTKELAAERKNTYVTTFLEPILQAGLPGSEVHYDEGISCDILGAVLPASARYQTGNCHIIFGDEQRTEFCNLYAYHKEEDSEGHTTEVTDFRGQLYKASFPTDMEGSIRILPSKRGAFGRKRHRYVKGLEGERELEFEDIHFNDHYTVYCKDETHARQLLNPEILAFLDDWADELQVAVYWDANQMLLTFHTGETILQNPRWKRQIEALSLTGEYAKVQQGLRRTYQLVDAMTHL